MVAEPYEYRFEAAYLSYYSLPCSLVPLDGKEFKVENVIKRTVGYLRNLFLAKLLRAEQWDDCCPKADFMTGSPRVVRPRKTERVQWRPPDVSWIKVNTDGVCKMVSRKAGGGRVIRNEKGDLLAGFAVELKARTGLQAEVGAVLQGLILAKNFGNHIWIEVDGKMVANWLSSGHLGFG